MNRVQIVKIVTYYGYGDFNFLHYTLLNSKEDNFVNNDRGRLLYVTNETWVFFLILKSRELNLLSS